MGLNNLQTSGNKDNQSTNTPNVFDEKSYQQAIGDTLGMISPFLATKLLEEDAHGRNA